MVYLLRRTVGACLRNSSIHVPKQCCCSFVRRRKIILELLHVGSCRGDVSAANSIVWQMLGDWTAGTCITSVEPNLAPPRAVSTFYPCCPLRLTTFNLSQNGSSQVVPAVCPGMAYDLVRCAATSRHTPKHELQMSQC